MKYRLALVTGATSGIGQSLCRLLAKKGIPLLITGRDREKLAALQSDLSKEAAVETAALDLAQAVDRRNLIALIHAKAPDLVINNAGFGLYGGALTFTTEEQSKILEVNGNAVLELTLEAARTLASAQKKGVILNVSSLASSMIIPEMAVYAAAKAFVSQFSQAVDFEFKPLGIRVLTLCPGVVKTAFQARASGDAEHTPFFNGMTADFAAEQLWDQIECLQPYRIIDWKCRVMDLASRLIPKTWLAALIQKDIQKRISHREIIKINTYE